MKIILLADSLQFVSMGTGKIHAVDRAYLAKYGYGPATMCGRDIPSGADVRPIREMRTEQVCGRCVASLRTYEGRMGTVAKVRFEQEVAS